MTRGRCGSLGLHRVGLSVTTPRRSSRRLLRALRALRGRVRGQRGSVLPLCPLCSLWFRTWTEKTACCLRGLRRSSRSSWFPYVADGEGSLAHNARESGRALRQTTEATEITEARGCHAAAVMRPSAPTNSTTKEPTGPTKRTKARRRHRRWPRTASTGAGAPTARRGGRRERCDPRTPVGQRGARDRIAHA